jgi:hypothetical protein
MTQQDWLRIAPQIFGGGTGISDMLQSNMYAQTPRPAYEIPSAMYGILNSAQSQALQTQLPGQGLMQEQMDATTAQGINASQQSASNPADILSMVAKLSGQQQLGMQNMAGQAAQNYNANQDVLRTALGQMAAEQSNQWKWDKQMPYLDAMKTAYNLDMAAQSRQMSNSQAFGGIMGMFGGGGGGGNSSGNSSGFTVGQSGDYNMGGGLDTQQYTMNDPFKKTLLNSYGYS